MTDAMKDAIRLVRESVTVSSVFKQFNSYQVITTRGNDVIMACPFHADNSPSLSLNDSIMRWHCFGCGSGGDVISAYAALSSLSGNHMNYYTAVRMMVQSMPTIGITVDQLKERKVLTMDNNTKAFRWKPTIVKTWSELYRIMPKTPEALYAVLDLLHNSVPLETIYDVFSENKDKPRVDGGGEEFILEME